MLHFDWSSQEVHFNRFQIMVLQLHDRYLVLFQYLLNPSFPEIFDNCVGAKSRPQNSEKLQSTPDILNGSHPHVS